MTVLWFTGLSGSGKTTLGKEIFNKVNKYKKVIVLDGDELRSGLNSDLGFSIEDRHENIRRVAHVAKMLSDNGHLVITTLISPTNHLRKLARDIVGDRFFEVYAKSSLEKCINRDVKKLYEKAIKGEIKEFTGVSSVYEEPLNADLIVDTENIEIEKSLKQLFDFIVNKKIIDFDLDENL